MNIFGSAGTGPGPVYPGLGGEPAGVLELTGGRTDDGWFREKLFWYVKPSYPGRALLRGDRLDGPGQLPFSGAFIPGRRRVAEMRLKPNGGTSMEREAAGEPRLSRRRRGPRPRLLRRPVRRHALQPDRRLRGHRTRVRALPPPGA